MCQAETRCGTFRHQAPHPVISHPVFRHRTCAPLGNVVVVVVRFPSFVLAFRFGCLGLTSLRQLNRQEALHPCPAGFRNRDRVMLQSL